MKTSVRGIRNSEDVLKAIRRIQAKGIRIMGGFIIGFDHYRHRDYWRLLRFFLRARLWLFSMTILVPFPGSALHERLAGENRLVTRQWGRYNLFWMPVFYPKHMSRFALFLWFWFIRVIALFLSRALYYPIFIAAISFCLMYFLSKYIFSVGIIGFS